MIILLVIFSLSPGHVSYSKSNNASVKPFGGTLTIGQIIDSTTGNLNPVLAASGVSAQLVSIIFDGLVRIGEEGEILPEVAGSWEMKRGGQEWIFHLRRGIRFHDGSPLTAADVEFTLNLAKDPHIKSNYAYCLQQIKKIEVRDSYTLGIHLIEPSASFIHALTVGILPRHLLEGKDIRYASFNDQPIGTGPFRFIRWSSDRVELGANQDYFLGRAYLDKVVVRLFKSQRLVWANLMKGEIDAFQLLDPASCEAVGKIRHFRLYSALQNYYYSSAT